MYDCARARLAMAHDVVKSISRASGLPWNEHVDGSAVTVTLLAFCAAASAGFADSSRSGNTLKYETAAIRQPAMMIGLRPILSESAPKITKKGVPMASEAAISRLAVVVSTFAIVVRKKSAWNCPVYQTTAWPAVRPR